MPIYFLLSIGCSFPSALSRRLKPTLKGAPFFYNALTARVPLRFCNWCSRLSSAARVKSLAIPFEGLSETLLTFSSHPQLVNGGSQSQVARICCALGHRRRVGPSEECQSAAFVGSRLGSESGRGCLAMEIQARTERWQTSPRYGHYRSKLPPSVAPSQPRGSIQY